MRLHLHRATTPWPTGWAAAGEPLPDPFATGRRPGARHGALAEPAALARARRGAGRATACARPWTSGRRGRWSPRSPARSDDDPWAPDALAWPLLDVIDGCLDEPWAATLGPAPRPRPRGRGGRAAARAAGSRSRGGWPACSRRTPGSGPSLVARLVARGTTPTARGGPSTATWPGSRSCGGGWSTRVGAPSPVERHRRTVELLREDPEAVDLPSRLSLFGHTRLSVTEIELLAALGRPARRPPLAAAPVAGRCGARSTATPGRRRARRRRQPPAGASPTRCSSPGPRHPRAAARAGCVRTRRLTSRSPSPVAGRRPCSAGCRPTCAPTSRGRRARTLRPGRPVGAGARLPRRGPAGRRAPRGAARAARRRPDARAARRAGDVSRHRDLRAADRGRLRPRRGRRRRAAIPAHRLRVRLADRSPVQTNPLLASRAPLLDLAGGRAQATQVLDLARAEPVRRRFGVQRRRPRAARHLGRASPACAGPSTPPTAPPFGLDDYVANTWEFGLDRLLTGVALSDDSAAWLDRALPLDDVGSAQVDLVGRLAEYVDRLRAVDRPADRHATRSSTGSTALDDGVAALTAVPSARRLAAGARCSASSAGSGAPRPGSGRSSSGCPTSAPCSPTGSPAGPTRANFRTGTLTVCTMVPMRSVPHRVVCLLGLDDGVFPRQGSVDGDDVLARNPLTGERDARSEDRQLLLDAILAATPDPGGHLHRGQRVLRAAATSRRTPRRAARRARPDGRHGRRAAGLARRHRATTRCSPSTRATSRREGWSPASRSPSTAAAAAGARAAGGPRTPRPAVPRRAPRRRVRSATSQLADLVRFWGDPVKGFLGRDGVDLALPADEEQPEDALPVEIDNLAQWAVGDRVLTDLLAGLDPRDRRSSASGGAASCRRASSAGGCSARSSTRARPLQAAAAELRTTPSREPSTSTSTSAAGAGCAARSPRCTATGWCR